MKTMISKYKNAALVLALGMTFGMTSCSDDYMTELNTNDLQSQQVEPSGQLAFALLSTYGNFNANEGIRAYVAPYTQMYGGSWNSSNAGGANLFKDNLCSSLWEAHYKNGLKNLIDAERHCGNDAVIKAAVRIHKVYLFNVLTDLYGDIPVTDAGLATLEGITTPRYDKQQDIYNYFFKELDESIAALKTATTSKSLTNGDVTNMKGDVQMWLRYANSLKMRLAMRISDVDEPLAKQKFQEANASGALTATESAYIRYENHPYSFEDGAKELDFRINAVSEIMWGQDRTSPTGVGMTIYNFLKQEGDPRLHHYCRFMHDCFRDNTDPTIGREDFTKEVLAAQKKREVVLAQALASMSQVSTYDDSLAIYKKTMKVTDRGVQMIPACWAWYDSNDLFKWPSATCYTKTDHYKQFIAGRESQLVDQFMWLTIRGSVATEFVRPNTPGMLVSGAEVCFLKAEAALKGWISGDAKTYFTQGVNAALTNVQNTIYSPENVISATDIDTYVTAQSGKFDLASDDEAKKELINTQAYFLHFANPIEAWANLRRADYPRLYERKQFGQGQNGYFDADGNMEQPVRLNYPLNEQRYNTLNYKEAISRPGLDGTFSWHKRMWWDTKDMQYIQFSDIDLELQKKFE